MIKEMLQSVQHGGMFTLGWFPAGEGKYEVFHPSIGGEYKRWGKQSWELHGRESWRKPSMPKVVGQEVPMAVTAYTLEGKKPLLMPLEGVTGPAGRGAIAMPLIAIGTSGYFIYKGWKGEMGPHEGWRGALDMATQDVAANTAIWAHAYTRRAAVTSEGIAGTLTTGRKLFGSHSLATVGIGFGAYAGAGIGQQLAGFPGAFAGAWLGGRIMRSPLSALAGAAVIGGGALVAKGAYSLLKSGYRRSQMQKGLDTAGDTADFFTNAAVTMRQRAVQAMSKSHLNARSALGQEATFMSMGRKDYFSKYRY